MKTPTNTMRILSMSGDAISKTRSRDDSIGGPHGAGVFGRVF